MTTRHDVAVLAGTSDAVVSYVINNGPRGVAPHTRQRVERAMATLGYRPNAIARSLAAKRSFTVGLVVPDISNPFFSELASGLENAAFDEGLTMLFGNAVDSIVREQAYIHALIDRQVDGLVVVPVGDSTQWLSEVVRAAVPTVMLDREVESLSVSSVIVDNRAGAFEATMHLVEHGHSLVGCIAGPAQTEPAAARALGWSDALTEAGLSTPDDLLAHVEFGRALAREAAVRMLSRPDRPTAIFVASDEQAAGVYRAAADLGLSIPGDVAICSFDGIAGASFMVPSLTTMQQPIGALAAEAIRLLVARIADPELDPERRVLASQLFRRSSCGCSELLIDGDEPENLRLFRSHDGGAPRETTVHPSPEVHSPMT